MNDPGSREGGEGDGSPPFATAVALLGIAGWVDAVGYFQLGHLFLSFMSGNTTQMAVYLGRAKWSDAGSVGVLIALFVCGVFIGTLLAGAAGKWHLPVVLGVEAALLVTGMLLPAPAGELPAAVFPVVLAMGLQNAALQRVGQKKISLTYVTGTLVGLGRGLAETVIGRGQGWAWSGDLLLWLAMASGAVAGAVAFVWLGFRALVIPTVAVLILAAARTYALLSCRRRE